MTPMLILNYSHPLTAEQTAALGEALGSAIEIRDIPTHVDRSIALAAIAAQLGDAAGLSPHEWQTRPIVLNPPGLAVVALALIAELHGRCGYFVPCIALRPASNSTPPRFEFAEIANLNAIREQARGRRS